MRIVILVLLVLSLGQHLYAADGVLEINQTCALNGGCFAGDSDGFPVTIVNSGSYRLTGNLDLTSIPDTIAIQIDAPHVTLDLGGFEIAGPVTCTGSGPTLDCGTPGSATGIRLNGSADGTLLRNGTIRNMNSSGVGSSGSRRETLSNLRAYNNARSGFSVGVSSIVGDCIAAENGDDGFNLGIGAVVERATAEGNGDNGFESDQKVVVDNSSTRRNGGRGYDLGPSSRFGDNTGDFNAEPDRCGGGVCSNLRRYLLTQGTFDGSQPLSACQDGFHMASMWELAETSNLQYDYILGFNLDDGGTGPPTTGGWIRTGSVDDSGSNCSGWSVNFSNQDGSAVFLQAPNLWDSPGVLISPWTVIGQQCNVGASVWCIED